MPMNVLSPICSLSSWAILCMMSMTNRPMAVVVSNFSWTELNSLPMSRRSSIMRAKLTLFLWIRSIFRTRRTSHESDSRIILSYSGRLVFLPENPSSL